MKMREYEFAECCRELSYRLNLDGSDTLRVTGAFVRGEKVGLLFNEDFDDGIDVYIDLGYPENAGAELEIFRELLNINLELSADRGESFGFHVESRHVVFRSFFRSEEISPERLADGILDYVSLVQELRTGPLSALVRPDE
jgi:hypothetical protein